MNISGISSYQTSFTGLVQKGMSTRPKLSPKAIEAVKAAKNELRNIENVIIGLEDEISMADSVCTERYMKCLQSRLSAAKKLRGKISYLIKNADNNFSYKSIKGCINSYRQYIQNIDASFDRDVKILEDMSTLRIPADHFEIYSDLYYKK